MSILYVTLLGNQSVCLTLEESREVCSPTGFTQPICFSRYVLDSKTVRLATLSELDKLPKEGEGVRHLQPVTTNDEILYRFDTSRISFGLYKLGWPNARYGEKTEQGYPLYIPEDELFSYLKGKI